MSSIGVYNPDVPYILGEEWVGIKNEDITFSPIINVQERGHTFTPTANRTLQDGRFYISSPPPSNVVGQQMGMAVYKTGTEAETGPVRMVTIPCNGVSVTGTGFSGSTLNVLAFQDPGDGIYIQVDPQNNLNQKTLVLQFAALQYAQLLNGKRILKVQLVHQISWNRFAPGNVVLADNPPTFDSQIQFFGLMTSGVPPANATTAGYAPQPNRFGDALNAMGIPEGLPSEVPLSYRSFGETNQFWFTPPYAGNPTIGYMYPWRYQELARFDVAAGPDRVGVRYDFGASSSFCGIYYLGYAALQVYFCDETRVAYGARVSSTQQSGSLVSYVNNTNIVTLRDTSLALNPVLTAGQRYTVTVTSPDIGDLNGPVTAEGQAAAIVNTYPSLNALRELAASPIHAGVQINVTQTPGQVFTKQVSHVLPQLSLHTSGGPLTEVHVYGRRAPAHVYGSITATQEILDGGIGGSFQFPQARFYARRFGDTTVPLTFAGTMAAGLFVPGVNGSNATTPDNAALDVLGDIDLRADLTMPKWASGFFETVVSKWNQNATNQRSYILQVTDTGFLQIAWSNDGTAVLSAASTVSLASIGVVDGQRLAIRATLQVNNGAGGRTINFFTAPTSAGPYVALGVPVIQAGVTSIFNSTAIGEISGHSGSAGNDTTQYVVHNAQILNGIAGTQVGNPDFGAQTPGTTSFTDAAGRVWTVNGTASIIGGTASSTASITPTAFDALTEIIDGWKQVDLRFTTIPTLGAGANPQFQWSAAGELAGNRWEVLGLYAPAVSATPGNNFNLVPANQRLSTATYGQPAAGDTINMGWVPQYAPPVSATADDPTADAVLLLSQDMPAVTGLLVIGASQAVTGIGQLCGINPWFIPNAISYNRVSWSATNAAVPVTGFGYYELQRQDSLTPWQTILYATSPTVTGFNDYEARASLSSDYRIRAVNSSLFAGQWSSTVSLTMAAPGITGTGMGVDDHVMIFTSNSYQNGSKNLAYSMAWETAQPTEAFTFPEAAFTQYQAMYNRNFFVAFRPTERGGEQFQRTILVQAAAIPPETLGDFTSLRDMAWTSLPYVCIRDEDGNRWFANVTVPTGRVMRDRKLYLADIGVVEVTDTAAPVTVSS